VPPTGLGGGCTPEPAILLIVLTLLIVTLAIVSLILLFATSEMKIVEFARETCPKPRIVGITIDETLLIYTPLNVSPKLLLATSVIIKLMLDGATAIP
jgi:hypothetical protein